MRGGEHTSGRKAAQREPRLSVGPDRWWGRGRAGGNYARLKRYATRTWEYHSMVFRRPASNGVVAWNPNSRSARLTSKQPRGSPPAKRCPQECISLSARVTSPPRVRRPADDLIGRTTPIFPPAIGPGRKQQKEQYAASVRQDIGPFVLASKYAALQGFERTTKNDDGRAPNDAAGGRTRRTARGKRGNGKYQSMSRDM